MTNKELRRLSRAALIDLLIEQVERNDELEAQIAKLERQVKSRTITLSPDAIEGAAVELNKLLNNGDAAALPYTEAARSIDRQRTELAIDAIMGVDSQSSGRDARSIKYNSYKSYKAYSPPAARNPVKQEKPKRAEPKRAEPPAPPPQRVEKRPVRQAPPPAAVDPFAEAPLDDVLDKAFTEMRRRNAR